MAKPQSGPMTGHRIRERRLDRGMRQADLARDAGISASYLNLIEHGRRRIGGKLLQSIARILDVPAQSLIEGAEGEVIARLRAAAARTQGPDAAVLRADDLAARFPGWAELVVEQDRRIAALDARVSAMADRMAHDPALATALHEIISTVTSIRSTSAILAGEETVDADWQRRFHVNIDTDARRLAKSSSSLVDYLEAAGAREGAGAAEGAFLLPHEEVPAFFEALPQGDVIAAHEIEEAVARSPHLRSQSARALAALHLRRRATDAAALPQEALLEKVAELGLRPDAMARAFGVDLAVVLRRLAEVPTDLLGRAVGIAICDAAGTILQHRPVAGFSLSQTGGNCPHWPLYRALRSPGMPIRQLVYLPGTSGQRFLCHAIAGPRSGPNFDAPMILEATMLVLPWPGDEADDGDLEPPSMFGCPVCRQPECTAGREDWTAEI